MIPETEREVLLWRISLLVRVHRKILVVRSFRCEVTVNQNNQGILERARESPSCVAIFSNKTELSGRNGSEPPSYFAYKSGCRSSNPPSAPIITRGCRSRLALFFFATVYRNHQSHISINMVPFRILSSPTSS